MKNSVKLLVVVGIISTGMASACGGSFTTYSADNAIAWTPESPKLEDHPLFQGFPIIKIEWKTSILPKISYPEGMKGWKISILPAKSLKNGGDIKNAYVISATTPVGNSTRLFVRKNKTFIDTLEGPPAGEKCIPPFSGIIGFLIIPKEVIHYFFYSTDSRGVFLILYFFEEWCSRGGIGNYYVLVSLR